MIISVSTLIWFSTILAYICFTIATAVCVSGWVSFYSSDKTDSGDRITVILSTVMIAITIYAIIIGGFFL